MSRATGSSDPRRYKDPSQPVEARVADLLARMTAEEKVAQTLDARDGLPGSRTSLKSG